MGRAKPHYAYVTRTLLGLFEQGRLPNVASVEVEPEYGYATRIHYRDGSVRVTRGGDVGLNPSAACEVVKDKGQTKFFLRLAGISCPAGAEFLLPWWARKLEPDLSLRGFTEARLAAIAPAYVAEQLGYPVYVKPVDGSRGANVNRCEGPEEVEEALAAFERERVPVAVVEEEVELPDHRLVVLDGEVISAYRRRPLAVAGDGTATISELLDARLAEFAAAGRACGVSIGDERVQACLRGQGLDAAAVPAAGQEVDLLRLSNLSLGGSAEDLTEDLDEAWADLAVEIARSFGMRYCGVDLACADVRVGDSAYSVIEVNSAPGLDHYAEVGPAQEQKVADLYAQVLNAFPQAPRPASAASPG